MKCPDMTQADLSYEMRDFHYFQPRKLGFKYMVKIEKYK